MRNRLLAAWIVLRGRPLMYRFRFIDTIPWGITEGATVLECHAEKGA